MSVCLKDTGSFCAYWRKEPRDRKASAIMANTIELKQQIQQGAYDAAFVKLYGADVDVNAQRERYISVIDQFENEFGSGRSVRLYSAPGRTEIGGNHTDHNNGVVLAGSVNLDIVAVVSPNEENIIRVKSLGFEKIDDVDASAMQDFLPRIAYRKGEFGKWLGETTPVMLDHFGIPVKTWSDDHRTLYWSNGHPKHHTNEDDGQLGCVLNCMWNRDPMAHAHVNFTRSGLPIKEMKHIAKVTWGDESAVDQIGDYTPTNTYKMKRLQWVIARTELHNMLGLCSWMAPWEYCPDEKNQYVGDPNMEAKIFSAVTGVNKTGDDLDKDGIRAWMLQRVYTMRQLGSSNMRKDHDLVPGWIYTDPKDRKPFTKGTVRMDPDDINKSFDIFFEQVGCDKETGVPTTDTLKAYRLDFVIPVLQKEGLIK